MKAEWIKKKHDSSMCFRFKDTKRLKMKKMEKNSLCQQ